MWKAFAGSCGITTKVSVHGYGQSKSFFHSHLLVCTLACMINYSTRKFVNHVGWIL